ncbi:MAG: UvrD-helicase domain-containing protein, partial [Clostridium sp.]
LEEKLEKRLEKDYKQYEYNPEREISIIIDEGRINENELKPNYYLTEEQYEIISRDIKPLFLFGSAGSGKTIISINKAFTICKNKNVKLKYMTYSKNLVDFSKEVFKEICKRNEEEVLDNAEFIEVNKFLLKQSKNDFYVKYGKFERWYKEQYNKENSYEIWKEIRGIIKGLVSIEWEKIEIDEELLIEDTKECLIECNLIKVEDKLILNTEMLGETYEKIKKNKNYKSLKKSMKNIYNYLDKCISKKEMISEETYLKLTSKYTVYEKEERTEIYKIAKKYNDWLKKNNLFDENDIGRKALKNSRGSLRKFDFLICDEIQDLTEIQIYALLKYTRNIENILFCGDYNQTINPTYFEPGRIEYLYKMNNGLSNFTKKYLSKNYRNSKNVVEMTNEITRIRQKYMKHKTDREFEKNAKVENGNIFILKDSDENRKEILQIAAKRHYVGIIASTEEEKKAIEESLKLKDTLFTINSIKGIERKYVVCINLISKYKEAWKKIFEDNSIEEKEKYRIAFNALYVGITRATETICFIESDTDNEIYRLIKKYGKYIEKFNVEKLNLSKKSTMEDYYELGRTLENEGEYKKAIVQYELSNMGEHDIYRCKGYIQAEEGYYESAGKSFLEAREYKLAEEQFRKTKNKLKIIETLVYQEKSFDYIKEEGVKMGVNIFKIVENNEDVEWTIGLKELYRDRLEALALELNKSLNEINERIKGIGEEIGIINELMGGKKR